MTPLSYRVLRHRLPNGLRLLISENRRLPLLSLTACVVAGADQNPAGRPGLANLTARLLDEGTEAYPAEELAELVEGTGGVLGTYSVRELSGLGFNLPARHWRLALEVMAETLRRPVFPRRHFLRERERLLNQLRAARDDPYQVADHLLSRVVYRGTPLEHPPAGTIHGVRKIRRDDVRNFHGEKYAPSSTLLAVAGDVDSAAVVEAVRERFGDWDNPGYRRDPLPPLSRQSAPRQRRLHLDREQLHILIGHLGVPRSHPDFHALQVLDIVLGSGPGFTSRVPRRLRDDQGLAYTTFSDITSSSGLWPGRFLAYVSTSPENQAAALEGLLDEIELLQREGISEEELTLAQDFLTGSFVFDFQSNADLARFLIQTELYGLGEDYPRRYPEIIRALTVEDVARVARLHLDPVNYTRVMVGPLR